MAKDNDNLKYYNELLRRIDIIIGLMLDLVFKGEKIAEKDRMFRLKQLGMENPEIGIIFGKSAEQVKKQIYSAKKKGKKKIK